MKILNHLKNSYRQCIALGVLELVILMINKLIQNKDMAIESDTRFVNTIVIALLIIIINHIYIIKIMISNKIQLPQSTMYKLTGHFGLLIFASIPEYTFLPFNYNTSYSVNESYAIAYALNIACMMFILAGVFSIEGVIIKSGIENNESQ